MGAYFTLLFRRAPAVTLTVALAGMLIVSPVRGLRPVRAARFTFWNEMKPGIEILSPLATWSRSSRSSPLMTSSTVRLRHAGLVRDRVDQLCLVHANTSPGVVGTPAAYPDSACSRGFPRVFRHRRRSGAVRALSLRSFSAPSNVSSACGASGSMPVREDLVGEPEGHRADVEILAVREHDHGGALGREAHHLRLPAREVAAVAHDRQPPVRAHRQPPRVVDRRAVVEACRGS